MPTPKQRQRELQAKAANGTLLRPLNAPVQGAQVAKQLTPQERAERFKEEYEALCAKWGIQIAAKLAPRMVGFQLQVEPQLGFEPVADWTPLLNSEAATTRQAMIDAATIPVDNGNKEAEPVI